MLFFIKSIISKTIIFPLAFILEINRWFFSSLKLSLFHQKSEIIEILAERNIKSYNRFKILIIITHIISISDSQDVEKIKQKVEKLTNVIDGILSSFNHCDFQIIINTVKEQHITRCLPDYQRRAVHVQEQIVSDPMFVGFKAQDELISRINDFDWFIFLEDDIVIHDSYLLEKLEMFNKNSGNERALLIPHRYEMWKGLKSYIDLFDYDNSSGLSIISIGNLKFSEYQNPHGAFFCLSKAQLEIWAKSGRLWKDKVTFVGPLESAVTGCLYECFLLYKPHANNQNFLEVQHYDTKYSQIHHSKNVVNT